MSIMTGQHLLLLNYLEFDFYLNSVLVVPESELEGLPVDDDAVDEAVPHVAGDGLDQLSSGLDLPDQRVSTWSLPLQTHVRPDTTYCLRISTDDQLQSRLKDGRLSVLWHRNFPISRIWQPVHYQDQRTK